MCRAAGERRRRDGGDGDDDGRVRGGWPAAGFRWRRLFAARAGVPAGRRRRIRCAGVVRLTPRYCLPACPPSCRPGEHGALSFVLLVQPVQLSHVVASRRPLLRLRPFRSVPGGRACFGRCQPYRARLCSARVDVLLTCHVDCVPLFPSVSLRLR